MKWVSVKDEMPKPFQVVWIAGGVGLFTGSMWKTITGCEWPGQTIAWEVTHWIPMEQPPQCTLDFVKHSEPRSSLFDQLAAITKPSTI